jgi:hypothetical protein|tara:strand:+ start:89 stop:364 length:276 start_codon:yes stop_codon:yes gene_type:complete
MKAIYTLYPKAVTIREETDGSVLVFDKDNNAVEINMTDVNNWVDPNAYKEKRLDEYPSIGDQLDMIYHNGDGGATFQAAIKAIKDKYPKPE